MGGGGTETSKVVQEVACRMFESGLSAAAIGRSLKLTPSAVLAALVAGGIEYGRLLDDVEELGGSGGGGGVDDLGLGKRREWGGKVAEGKRIGDKRLRELICRCYREFRDIAAFCARMGINTGEFYLVIAEEGEKLRGRPPEALLGRKRRDEEIASLYREGLRLHEIKRLAGMRSIAEVHLALAREGVPRDTGEERSRRERTPTREELDKLGVGEDGEPDDFFERARREGGMPYHQS